MTERLGLLMIVGGDDDREIFWQTAATLARRLRGQRRVAVLMEEYADWKKWLHLHEKQWRNMGFREIHYFLPKVRDKYTEGAVIDLISWADLVFIFGGDTRKYHRYYCTKAISRALREGYQHHGKSIAGMSAGALLLPRRAIIWGSEVSAKGSDLPLQLQAKVARDRRCNGDVEFRLGRGFGLVDHIMVDVHFTEYGRYPRLAHALSLSRRTKDNILGIGLDADAAAILLPDGKAKILGSGRITLMRLIRPLRRGQRTAVEMQRLKPGDNFLWREERGTSG